MIMTLSNADFFPKSPDAGQAYEQEGNNKGNDSPAAHLKGIQVRPLTKQYFDPFHNRGVYTNPSKKCAGIAAPWPAFLRQFHRTKNSFMAKYSKGSQDKVEKAMHEEKRGQLKSGRSGKTVKSRKQAIAIGLSEARKEGKKVPPKKGAKKKAAKKSAPKKAAKKASPKKAAKKSAKKR